MKRLVALVCAMVLCMGMWASDLVNVGSYVNPHNGKEYTVYLEYEGQKIKGLEITTRPSKSAKGTSIILRGSKKIFKFNKCLKELLKQYEAVNLEFAKYDDNKRLLLNPNVKSFKHRYYENISWPRVNVQGVLSSKKIGYDRYEIYDKATIGYNFVVSKGACELGIIAVAEGYVESRQGMYLTYEDLKTTLHFSTPQQFKDFIRLTDIDVLKARMEAKRSAENKK